jgi:MoxR-like ATPase
MLFFRSGCGLWRLFFRSHRLCLITFFPALALRGLRDENRSLRKRGSLKAEEIIEARDVVRQVYLDEKIERYIVDIVFATRYPEKYDLKELKSLISFGGSPRASINLALASRTYAFIKRRGYVVPEDVRAIAHDVLRHRIGLTYEAEADNVTSEEIISKILNKVEVP